jgi:ubiquinone/menaquinone biosynthesis C-methylase UbiE
MPDGILADATCPWWLLPTFDNPLRRRIHPAARILSEFVRSGDTVLEPGCGKGYFTMALAHQVGPSGRILAIDLQEKMLSGLRRRAIQHGLSERVETKLCGPDRLGVTGPVDFALGFWMVHEVADREGFLREIRDALRPGGKFLVAEPRIHVSRSNFERTLAIARDLGFEVEPGPRISLSRSVVLAKLH